MKTIARYLLAVAALGVVGLFSGCETPNKGRMGRLPSTSFSMKVVESSSNRQLSPEEMKKLHDATIKFLARQGEALMGGTYYVRVNFAPTTPGEPGEWVLVQIISEVIDDRARVAAYRDSSPYYYPGYASAGSSGYYPDYYFDPYDYSSGGGYYRPSPRNPSPGHKPGDRDDDDRAHNRNGGDRSSGNYAGGNDRDHRTRTADHTPRNHDSGWGRDSGGSSSSGSGTGSSSSSDNSSSNSNSSSSGGSSYTSAPAPSSPEPAPRNEPVSPAADRYSVPTNEK